MTTPPTLQERKRQSKQRRAERTRLVEAREREITAYVRLRLAYASVEQTATPEEMPRAAASYAHATVEHAAALAAWAELTAAHPEHHHALRGLQLKNGRY